MEESAWRKDNALLYCDESDEWCPTSFFDDVYRESRTGKVGEKLGWRWWEDRLCASSEECRIEEEMEDHCWPCLRCLEGGEKV